MRVLINAESGLPEDVENPEQAFLSGTHGLEPGQTIQIKNPETGDIFSGPSDNIQAALNQGFVFASPEEIRERQLQKEHGEGFESGVKALGEGIARGVSFGLSDIVLQNVYDVSQEALRERKKRRGGLALSGEIGGAALPILLSGGAGAAGAISGMAPTARLAKIGTRIEKQIAKKIVSDGMKKKVIPKAISTGVEGGIYGLGQLTSEASLGNIPLTADNVISHVGMGSLIGGGLSGGLGIGKFAGGKAIKPVKSLLEKLPSPVKSLKELEDLFTIKATGAMKPQIRQIREMRIAGGDQSKVAQILRNKKIVGSGASYDATKKRAVDELKKAGKNLDDAVNQLDSDAQKLGIEPEFDDIWGKVKEDIIDPLVNSEWDEEVRLGQRLLRDADRFVNNWKGKKIPVRKVIEYRRSIRKQAWKGKTKLSQDTFGAYKDEIGSVFKEIEEELADSISDQVKSGVNYKQAKTDWQVMDWANKALGNKIDSETANLFMSLTDRMASIGGATASSLAKGAIDPTAILMGAGAGIAHRTIRTRGASIAAGILNRVNNLNALNKVNERATSGLFSAVNDFLKKESRSLVSPTSIPIFMDVSLMGEKSPKTKNLREAYMARRKDVEELATNPERTLEKVANSTEGIAREAPAVAREINERQARAIRFLWDKMPKDKRASINFVDREYMPNDSDISKWARYYSAVVSPGSIIEDIRKGSITNESVEVLKEIYPPLYNQIVEEMISVLGSSDEKIKYHKANYLSNLFDINLSDYNSPQFVEVTQQTFSPSQMAPPPGPERTPARAKGLDKVNVAGRSETTLDRISKGD